MNNQIPRVTFLKMAGALALVVACLALLSPCFTASASRGSGQDLPQNGQAVPAPSQSIQPSAMAVVNFKKLAQREAQAKALAPVFSEEEPQVAVHPPLTIPEPEDSTSEFQTAVPAQSTGAPPSELGDPLIPSPAPAANFQAIDDDTHNIPPDTMGAVGPDKIFVNVNGNYRILNKTTGGIIANLTISAFWSAVTPPVSGVFDPRVIYDPYNNRWIAAAASNASSSNASILVGVSASSDPQGSWTLARFIVGCGTGQNGCDTNGEWADFPMLGFNKNWIAVGWNVFAITGGGNVGGKVIAIDYPSFRAGTNPPPSTVFTVNGTTNPGLAFFCMHPAETYSSTEETLYVPVHFSSSNARYQLHKITGTPSAPVYTLETMLHTRTGGGWQSISGDILPQNCTGTCPTTLAKINSNDQFLRSNVVFRNNNIWYSQTIGLAGPSPSPTVSPSPTMHTAVQWTRIDTSGVFVDGGRVEDPNATADNGGEWYAYPSIAVNAHNDVLLGFSTFSSSHFVRAAYAFRAGNDANGTMRDPVIFKDGSDYYAKKFSGSSNRWGDYSHTVVDPSNDLDMWTVQEYAETRVTPTTDQFQNASRWGTWWAKVADQLSPPPPTPSPTATPSPIPSPQPPANDNFANAQQINGCTGTITGNNDAATKETGEPSHDPSDSGSGSPRVSVWYKWQAPATASVTFDTIGSNFDTILAVYTGGSLGSLTRITFQDDINPGVNQQSQVTFPATAGTVYMIAVDGYAPETGNIKLNWTEQSCSTTVQLNASNFSIGEGGGSATVTVARSGNTAGTSTVDYKTTDTDTFSVNCSDKHGNAFARCDFATVIGTVSFAGGETSKTFLVPIIDDGYAEGPETFGVALTNPSGATVGAQGTASVTINDNEATDQPNPILQTNAAGVDFFVRQHYLDFLGREPEPGQPWSGILNGCADQFNTNPASPSAGCDRINVSGSFFGSPEYKTKGFYVIDMYRVAFNRLPTYVEFSTDLASITGATAQEVFAKRAAYANSFVQRTEFMGIYNSMGNSAFVNALMSGAQGQAYNLTSITTPDPANPDGATKVTLNSGDLVTRLNFAVMSRAQVLRAIAQSDEISLQKEAVNAFVGSQYYGYLRRTPDQAGFNSWVTYLTANPNDFRTMVNGFVNSPEYRLRFGPTGSPPAGVTLSSLSSNSIAPFSVLTLSGSGFDGTAAPVVHFSDSSGFSDDVPPIAVSATSMKVVVPSFVNPATGALRAATASVQVIQTSSSSNSVAGLQVLDLPTPAPKAGTLTLNFLKAAQSFSSATLVTGIKGTTLDTPSLNAALANQNANLDLLIQQIDTVVQDSTKTFILGTISGTQLTITSSELLKVDRMILGMLATQAAVNTGFSSPVGANFPLISPLATCQSSEAKTTYDDYINNPNAGLGSVVGYYGASKTSPNCSSAAAVNTGVSVVTGSGAVALGLLALAGAPAEALALPAAALLYISLSTAGGEIAIGGALGQATSGAMQLVQSGMESLDELFKVALIKGSIGGALLKIGINPEPGFALASTVFGSLAVHNAFTNAPPLSGGGTGGTNYNLNASKAGTGDGAFNGYATNIVCGTGYSVCGDSLPAGTTVILNASAFPGSTFTGWSGACSGTGSCKITMNSNQSVTATFTKATTLTVSPSPINTTVNCQLNPPPGNGSFTLFNGQISVNAPANFAWTATIPTLPEPGSTVTVSPSAGTGPAYINVTIKYPSKVCTCPCSLSWASGTIAEFRQTGQQGSPLASLPVQVDYSTCVCNSPLVSSPSFLQVVSVRRKTQLNGILGKLVSGYEGYSGCPSRLD